jgi:hypothetical protein
MVEGGQAHGRTDVPLTDAGRAAARAQRDRVAVRAFSLVPARPEVNSHRCAPRAVQIAQRRLAGRRSWYEPGCRHRPQGGPAEMPVSEHARRARERDPRQLSATSGRDPLSGGVLIGGEGRGPLDRGALEEAEDDLDGGPGSDQLDGGLGNHRVGGDSRRGDTSARRRHLSILRGTAQVCDLRGGRRVTLRRGRRHFARRRGR